MKKNRRKIIILINLTDLKILKMISKKLSRSKTITKDLILNSDITQEISKKMRVENLEILLKTER